MQLLVISVFCYQFFVGTTLHNPALVQDADFVGMLDGTQSVGYCHGGTGLHQSLQGILYQTLALCIKSRCCLVEDKDRRILEDGTGYAHTLALTAGESAATITDSGIKTMFRLGNELVGIGYLCRIGDIFIGSIGLAEADIVLEAGIEEDCLLVYITYQLSEIVYAEVLHVDAFDELFKRIRSHEENGVVVPKKEILRYLVDYKRKGIMSIFGYISDQGPKWENIHLWLPFIFSFDEMM